MVYKIKKNCNTVHFSPTLQDTLDTMIVPHSILNGLELKYDEICSMLKFFNPCNYFDQNH